MTYLLVFGLYIVAGILVYVAVSVYDHYGSEYISDDAIILMSILWPIGLIVIVGYLLKEFAIDYIEKRYNDNNS